MRSGIFLVALACAFPAVVGARPDSKNSTDMWKYGGAEVVNSFASVGGQFRIHYTETGVDAVPAGDVDHNGTPDYVEGVAALYDRVLAFYVQLGFKRPPDDGGVAGNNGGDARFDVYLIDFGGGADGHFQREQCTGDVCEGYMVQENDFVGYPYNADVGNRILSSHEFFHAVQAGYNANQSTIISEGTAVWATETFDSTLGDFESLVPGYLDRPDRPLDKPLPGAVDPFSYGTAIWWEFLAERFGNSTIRALWEGCVDGAGGVALPLWWDVMPQVIAANRSTFAAEFSTFARWNLLTGNHADPTRAYKNGGGYPLVKLQATGRAPYSDDTFRIFYASTQYLHVPIDGQTQMTAYIKGLDAATPVTLALTTRTGTTIGDFVDVPLGLPSTSLPSIATGGADEMIVIAVNTAQSGDSAKGTLCAGTPEQVMPCAAGPMADDMLASAPDLGTGPATGGSGGGGCGLDGRRSPATADGGGVALLGLTLLLARVRRRKRRTDKEQQ